MVFEEMKTGYQYLSTHKNTQYTSCTIPPHPQAPILPLFFLFCIYFFIFIFGPFSFTFPPLFHSEFSLQGASDKTPPNNIPFTLLYGIQPYLFMNISFSSSTILSWGGLLGGETRHASCRAAGAGGQGGWGLKGSLMKVLGSDGDSGVSRMVFGLLRPLRGTSCNCTQVSQNIRSVPVL